MMKNSAVLLLSCPDRKGVVATVSGFIYEHGGNILSADEHGDLESNTFLMRVEFDPAELDLPLSDFASHFSPIAEEFQLDWRLAMSDRWRLAEGLIIAVIAFIVGYLFGSHTGSP